MRHFKLSEILLALLGGLLTVTIALLSGLWWLSPKGHWQSGAWGTAVLWAFAFNRLPTQGRKCLENKFNMRFVLPCAVLSALGCAAGLFIRAA